MEKRPILNWINRPTINQILLACFVPRTPRQIERQLGIKKLKIKPFLKKGLLKPLNPSAGKGRFFVLSSKARRLLDLPAPKQDIDKDWRLIGWILASPKQRLAVLETIDSAKRTSEEIRERASRLNPHLSRTSTKGVLRRLGEKGLIKSELTEKKKYYWISEKGKATRNDLDCVRGKKGK